MGRLKASGDAEVVGVGLAANEGVELHQAFRV